MKYIQERLGHKSIEITSNIYSHVTPKIIENEQSKYEAYVGQEFIFRKRGKSGANQFYKSFSLPN